LLVQRLGYQFGLLLRAGAGDGLALQRDRDGGIDVFQRAGDLLAGSDAFSGQHGGLGKSR